MIGQAPLKISIDYIYIYILYSTTMTFYLEFVLHLCIDRLITLKHIVLGYKPFDKDCFYFNYLLIIIGISIYKDNIQVLE
jgi:hypothetical protein